MKLKSSLHFFGASESYWVYLSLRKTGERVEIREITLGVGLALDIG